MRLKSGTYYQGDIDFLLEQYEKMRQSCEYGRAAIRNLSDRSNSVLVTQRFEITAAFLLTTDVSNDTLITTGSPSAFRWNIAVFPYAVSVGFGESVEPWVKLNDTTHNNDAFKATWSGSAWTLSERSGLCLSVYQQPTHLQCLEWDSHILKPKAWVIGQTVQLVQLITDKVKLP